MTKIKYGPKIYKKDVEERIKYIEEKMNNLKATLEMWEWLKLLIEWDNSNKNNYIYFSSVDKIWGLEGLDEKRFILIKELKLDITIDIVNILGIKEYSIEFVKGKRKKS